MIQNPYGIPWNTLWHPYSVFHGIPYVILNVWTPCRIVEYHVTPGMQLGGLVVRILACEAEGPEFDPQVGHPQVFKMRAKNL